MSDVAESATSASNTTTTTPNTKRSKQEVMDLRSKEGITALHLASKANNHETIKVLIYHGANLDIADYTGSTPLITSIKQGTSADAETADLLLKYKHNHADPTIKLNNQTPMQICLTHEKPNLDIFKSLLKYTPKISETDLTFDVIKDTNVRETFQKAWSEFKMTIIDNTARELKEQGLDLPYSRSSTNSVLHNLVESSGEYVNNVQYEELAMPEHVIKAKAAVAEHKKKKEEEAKQLANTTTSGSSASASASTDTTNTTTSGSSASASASTDTTNTTTSGSSASATTDMD